MDEDTLVSMQNERLARLQHAEKASAYLVTMGHGIDLLCALVYDNVDGRYSYAMQSLVAYLRRLRSDTQHHSDAAQGLGHDDIAF